MKVQSLYLENVRGLPSMRLNFVDRVSQKIRPRTVIAGSNGSGKTTILEVIGQLLGAINTQRLDWIELENALANIIITGLPPNGEKRLTIDVEPTNIIQIAYIDEESDEPDITRQSGGIFESGPDGEVRAAGNIKIYRPAQQIGKQIRQATDNNSDYPNCIYFPSEDRLLHKKQKGEVIAEPPSYEWVYRFSDSDEWRGSLESFLVDMYFTDVQTWYKTAQKANGNNNPSPGQGDFSKFVERINKFLSGKKIQDVSEEKRVQIKTDNGLELSFDQLSSGEKQIILLLGEIQRRIQRGSIVMIDEPEIHLHPRWQRMLIGALTDLCEEYDAQLIITTQSEEIANIVYEHELVLLDRIFESVSPSRSEMAEAL